MTKKLFNIAKLLTITLLISGCNINNFAYQKATLPLDWPLSPLTEKQKNAVKDCNLEDLASERYPETIKVTDFETTFRPKSECDWAVLALAYADRLGEDQPLPEAGINAFRQAVKKNYGFALATPVFYNYFGATSIVNPPPFSQQDITDLKIQYEWGGLGKPVDYQVEIHQANVSPIVKITPDSVSTSANANIDKELIQALSPTLGNLLPVKSWFSINPCTDNYPQWYVQIVYRDGTVLDLVSESNFISMGGPWETEINKQIYVHYSTDFISALDKILTSMRLPHGHPAAWTCSGDEVFDQAFPLQAVTTPEIWTTPKVSAYWWTTWLTQSTCQPPCWQNIIPGVTTKDDALSNLKKMPDMKITYDTPSDIEWDFGPNETEGGWLRIQDGIVEYVTLATVNSNLTLDKVIPYYSYPGYVVPEDCRYGMCVTVLVYPELGLVLEVFVENKGWDSHTIQVEILPDAIIDRAYFTKPGMENFRQNFLVTGEDVPVMEWKGYGEYPE